MLDHGASILDRMKGNDRAPPNTRTYARLIDACAKAENWEQAVRYLNEMRDSGIP